MKKFRYVGAAPLLGVTFPDGREVIMHRGREYTLDENNGYVKSLLAKRNDNGMPGAWLVEVTETAAQPVTETAKPNKTKGDEHAS